MCAHRRGRKRRNIAWPAPGRPRSTAASSKVRDRAEVSPCRRSARPPWPRKARHAACNVKGGTVFDCTGPVKRVPWAAYNEPGPKGAAKDAPKLPAAQTPAPADDPNQPPRTVEEMAKRANQKTAEQIKKANEDMKDQAESFGDKVGDTTKKTWRCISLALHALHRVAVDPARLSGGAATRVPGAGLRRSPTCSSRRRSPCGSAWLPRCRAAAARLNHMCATHQVERNLAPYAVHQPQLKQSIRRAATRGELDGLYYACIKSCHDTGLCLPGLSVRSERRVDGARPLDPSRTDRGARRGKHVKCRIKSRKSRSKFVGCAGA